MAYINEFPHTRNYDQDLGQLICMYKKLTDDYDTLVKIYEIVKQEIKEYSQTILNEYLASGQLIIDATYNSETETLSFIYIGG